MRLRVLGVAGLLLLGCALMNTSQAQTVLSGNEPMEARFEPGKQAHTWTVVLEEDAARLRFHLQSATGAVTVQLRRDDVETGIPIFPASRKGTRVAGKVRGKDIDASTRQPLTKGNYTITVSTGKTSIGGDYLIQLVEPQKSSQEPAGTDADTAAELERMRVRLDDAMKRIAALEAWVQEEQERAD